MSRWHRSIHRMHEPLGAHGYVTSSQPHIDLSCQAAAEGMVLLKNDGTLPLKKGEHLVLLGKATRTISLMALHG